MSRDELRISIPHGPNQDATARAVIAEFQRRVDLERAGGQQAVNAGQEHLVIEGEVIDAMYQCASVEHVSSERCVLVEHAGNMHMKWVRGRAEYWVDA